MENKTMDTCFPKISVVIPTKNEAKNLEIILKEFPEHPQIQEIIIVDANSQDGTSKLIQENYPNILFMSQVGKGKGSAMKQGVSVAKGDYVLFMDADGSMMPGEIISFIEAINEGYDFVKGSRVMENGGSDDLTRFRKFGNWVFTSLVNVFFKAKYSDLCYGYFAIKKDLFEDLNLKSDGFSIEAEIGALAAKRNLQIKEIPSYEKCRMHGKSNLSAFKDGWRILKIIFRVAMTKPNQGE